ncbi:MAG: hypothetical protein ACD_3C00230G0002 [uncultured bacterium (gcode 4)]|uniref:Uncharacterized protein n=1 Tax=uncultured bacterium (gcode 4) TaxID=1234023 RepID=K2FWA6_9BACT|nr:MAG: hypothetical protein ACD_3C00230G0002 [uncultured bacterium (gcode 4)]
MWIENIDSFVSKIVFVWDDNNTLEKVSDLNKSWKFVIFAPNHITPHSDLRHKIFTMPDDFWALKNVLEVRWIKKSKVVFRWDSDMAIDSRMADLIYTIHSRFSHALFGILIDWYPIHLNVPNNQIAQKRNFHDVKRILNWLKDNNIIIFPYWNWWGSWKQDFIPETAYDTKDKRFYSTRLDSIKTWHEWIKPWFAKMAIKNNSPIIPIYVYRDKQNKWYINIWKALEPEWTLIEITKAYIGSMAALKDFIFNIK